MRQASPAPDLDKVRPVYQGGMVRQVRDYDLLTPLYGGGVVPGEADPVTTLRGPSVRGQLRFWWRATRGGQFGGDLAAMKEFEDRLWGAAASEEKTKRGIGPSPVQIEVVVVEEQRGEREWPYADDGKVSNGWAELSYAAFPLQPNNRQQKPAGCVRATKGFTLIITFPARLTRPGGAEIDAATEVAAALWAWDTFGGIGARTRRGFGALRLLAVDGMRQDALRPNQAEAKIKEKLGQIMAAGTWPEGVPYLDPQKIKCTVPHDDATMAWAGLLVKLKNFRQSGRPGRSHWPEPDEIRRRTNQHLQDGARVHAPVHPVRKFPRAAFGLPIVFHFKDNDRYNSNAATCDPADTTLQLQGQDFDRVASPLLLRPFRCRGKAVGLAAVLTWRGALPAPLVLNGASGAGAPPDMHLTPGDETYIPPLRNSLAPVKTDVLQAFLETIS